ncbi:MAG: hypothetical protein ACYC2E_15030 [Sulfuricella sp.]
MNPGFALFLGLILALPAAASPWEFQPPLAVTRTHGAKVFHHLESAGRKSIAVSAGAVAVVWEDNRSGQPQCYVAVKFAGSDRFGREYRLSQGKEAYEPAIVGLGKGRFAAAWEENGRVWARSLDVRGVGPVIELSGAASQATLAYAPGVGLYAAWAKRAGRYSRIMLARIRAGKILQAGPATPVDAVPPADEQLYPSLAVNADGAVAIAWEDRRRGHTLILRSHAPDDKHFAAPNQLNASLGGNALGLGRGSGVMRVALASFGKDGVAAVWADKRDFLSGYDIYAGFSQDRGVSFGPNQKVQDSFGDSTPQWHPAVAGNGAGLVAVAWDDDRDGTPDVWLSWPADPGWGGDLAVPGASGPGIQTDPALALDEAGNLHLVWVEKDEINGPSRIRYVLGKRSE